MGIIEIGIPLGAYSTINHKNHAHWYGKHRQNPKDFVLQPNNRDTKVANDIPCETNCPDNAKKIGTSADSPMYPKDNAVPEKVVITNSASPYQNVYPTSWTGLGVKNT